MSNRYYTVMIVPERSSRVKKWIVSRHLLVWSVVAMVFLFVMGTTTFVLSLRYLARHGEFNEALLKNQYLEGQLFHVQNELASIDANLVRLQNFEQKLRVIAQLEPKTSVMGIGPLTSEDSEKDAALMTGSDFKAPVEYAARMKSMEISVDDLDARMVLQEQSFQEMYELLKDEQSRLSSTPSIWPARGLPTSEFGYRISPITGQPQLHAGLDIGASFGAKVSVTGDGLVTFVGTDPGYGKIVAVNHGYGYVTRYGHNSEILVKVGQKVKRGEVVALAGNTGRTTGPHVHYEVIENGVPKNPRSYLF